MFSKIIIFFSVLAGVLMLISCEKDLPTLLEFPSYAFTSNDAGGGKWKPILIGSGTAIALDTPQPVSSMAYRAELTEVKAAMRQMTSEQKKAVAYWTSNPVVRWNEVALELIARYNLIPGYNEDGTYSQPDPANPAGPPAFPFAHPPYASRALAYLSVAQFDGLIAAWQHKYTYNRAAPYIQDATISYAYEKSGIPSYPSHEAVVASVSREILSVMFPLEKEYLRQLEAEHLQSLILSGGNVASDVQAGVSIGKKIATLALARAATDGMKNAQTSKVVSDSIKAVAFARFGWQWENQEIPARPVGLLGNWLRGRRAP